MSKHTFIGFIVAFSIIILVVSLYYNFSAKDSVEPSLEPEVTTTTTPTAPEATEPVVTEDSSSGNSSNSGNSTNTDNNVNPNTNSFTFNNEFGSGDKTTTISALQAEKLSGFSGASNNVYYIDGRYDLYHLELTNLVKTKLASNIDHFDMRDGMITAYYKHPHDVYEENQYVTYKEFS